MRARRGRYVDHGAEARRTGSAYRTGQARRLPSRTESQSIPPVSGCSNLFAAFCSARRWSSLSGTAGGGRRRWRACGPDATVTTQGEMRRCRAKRARHLGLLGHLDTTVASGHESESITGVSARELQIIEHRARLELQGGPVGQASNPRMSSAVRPLANSSPSSMTPRKRAALRSASARTFCSMVSRAISR